MRGHVRRRGTAWAIVYDQPRGVDGSRKQRWESGFKTRKAAEERLAEVAHNASRGRFIDPGTTTVGQLLNAWLDARAETVRPKTLSTYRELCEAYIIPVIGGMRLMQLRPLHVEQLMRELVAVRTGKPLSGKSRLHVYRVLHQALNQAVQWQLLGTNPAVAVKPPSGQRGHVAVLDRDQLRLVLAAVRDSQWYAVLVLMAKTGLRRGEALALRWQDIDLDGARLHVRQTLEQVGSAVVVTPPKTPRSRRTVALDSTTVEVLKRLRTEQREVLLATGIRSELCWFREDGSPRRPASLTQFWSRMSVRSGLGSIHLHALRHTHATQLLRAGVSPKVVAERLGHASVAFTMETYAAWMGDLQAAAVAAIEGDFEID